MIPEGSGRTLAGIRWRRVLVAVAAAVAGAGIAWAVVPLGVTIGARTTNVGDGPAYPDLRLPRARTITVTDESFGAWAGWCGVDGTIKITRSAHDTWEPERYQRMLIHEHGHALLDDIVTEGRYWSPLRMWRYERISTLTRRDELPSDAPDGLGPVFAAYEQAPDAVYESELWRGLMATHFTDSFGEYFAESFARWRMGDEIDPEVAAALEDLTD